MSLVILARNLAAVVMMSCLVMSGGRAEACMICVPFPEDTATSQLLQAVVVVLARENEEKLFSYAAVEVLKGDLDDPAIDLFVNQTLNLSAWATALIEIDEEQAIDWLEAVYLGKPGRDPDTVLEIVKALSVHGARNRPELRRRIAESYEILMQTHQSLAGWAARDLTAWGDWRFAETLAELRKSQSEIDGATAYAIDYYIGRSQMNTSN